MGAMAASLLFMPLFGVGYTVIVNLLLLVVLAVVLAPRRGRFWRVLPICFCGVLAVWANNHYALQGIGVIRDNEYNTIRVHTIEKEQSRILELNRTGASKYAENIEFRFPYIAYLQRNFLDHLAFADEPKDILVIGAGGFVLGLEDGYNRYTFVDIDDDLLEVSETYLLQQKLGENKVFYPEPARGFLARDTKQYDMVLLDVYTNIHGIPPQLLTMEFLQELRDKLKMKGVLVANIVTTANFSERFSIAFDNTFRQVFSHFTRQVVQDFNPWSADDRDYQNILYIYQNLEYGDAVYTDDKNTLVYDRPLLGCNYRRL
ncbi:MAG: spermidine synthase, partial [Rickettsiales bacterium]